MRITTPEYDGVLHEWEEDEEHAGQQPDLHCCDSIRHRDSSPRTYPNDNSIKNNGGLRITIILCAIHGPSIVKLLLIERFANFQDILTPPGGG
jgi:hypothetical protein